MEIYSIWPSFLLFVFVFAIFQFAPFFSELDKHIRVGAAFTNIDGLRGFLALGVFLHHALITYSFLSTGVWQNPPSQFYTMIGQVSVALFFMISGFLFWDKVIREDGKIRWTELYIGRVFRIAPVYWAAVGLMIVIVFVRSGFALHVSIGDLYYTIAQWILGLGFLNQANINGYPQTGLLLAGITWTLHYEWIFYASLWFFAYLSRAYIRKAFVLFGFTTSLIATAISGSQTSAIAALFFSGMIAATFAHDLPWDKLKSKYIGGAALLTLIAVFVFFDTIYKPLPIILLTLVFMIIGYGNDLLGAITNRAARRLGTISYSTYMFQGLILTIVFSIPAPRNFGLASPLNYWLMVALCAVLLTALSTASYCLIEHPAIAAGKKFAKSLRGKKH